MTSTPSAAPIRILVADDQELVRAGLAALLDLEPDIDVVAQANSGKDIVGICRDCNVDVALVDIEMPEMDGIAATRALTEAGSRTRVLIVTTFGRAGYLQRCMAAGAAGFMVKDAAVEELAQAIRTIAAGGRVVDPLLAAEALTAGPNPLTPRERDVLRGSLSGKDLKRIAAELYLSPGTVRNLASAAITKTGTSNRLEASRYAEKMGWL